MNRREQNAQPATKKNKFSLKNVLKEVGGTGGRQPGRTGGGRCMGDGRTGYGKQEIVTPPVPTPTRKLVNNASTTDLHKRCCIKTLAKALDASFIKHRKAAFQEIWRKCCGQGLKPS